jgi:hypothetical protein
MNKRIKIILLAGILLLLFAACGPMETAPVSEETSEPILAVTESPADVQSGVPAEGLAPEKVSNFIGLKYPPLPVGLIENFALLIQDSEDHSLSLISDGQNTMLWLGKMTHRDSNGNAFWEVKDILDLTDLVSGLALLPDGCLLHGQPDGEILIVGREGVILSAWRANTTLDVFQVLPTDGIECQSDKGWSLE